MIDARTKAILEQKDAKIARLEEELEKERMVNRNLKNRIENPKKSK